MKTSLPQRLDHVVATIDESKDRATLTLDELNGSLEAHEKRISRFTHQIWSKPFIQWSIWQKRKVQNQNLKIKEAT